MALGEHRPAMARKSKKPTSEPEGALIGYAMAIRNATLAVDFLGSPHEILEAARARSLAPRKLGSHPDTELTCSEVFKQDPEMAFSGPDAMAVLELLGALQEPKLKRASSILDGNQSLLSRRGSSAQIPLLAAAAMGRLDAVDLLLRKKARVDGTTQFDMSPLHWAAAKGRTEVAIRLLDAGADGGRLSWFCLTPDELAFLNGHPDTARVVAERTKGQPEGASLERIVKRMGLVD
jgi:hypothetical protein